MIDTRHVIKEVVRPFLFGAIALLLFLNPAGVFAQEQEAKTLVKKAFQEKEIDRETYLLYRIQAQVAPETLPVNYRSLKKPAPNRDMTTIISEIRLNFDTFSEETRRSLRPFLLRPTDASYTVWGIDWAYTVTEATPYDTTHFRIHYVTSTGDAPSLTDADTSGVPDYVEQMGSEFENVYSTEITSMGYAAPPSDGTKGGNSKFDVYIKNIGGYGIYGWCDPEGVSAGSSYYSFMVMDDDFSAAEFPTNTPLENLQVTAAHEFHHAVQNGYNVSTATWYKECTSVWMEDEVYDAVNDNLQYLPNRFADPDVSWDISDDNYWYGSWLWNRCLSERYGPGIVKAIWDRCKTVSAINAIVNELTARGTTLTDAFVDFSCRNYTKNRRYYYSSTVGEPYEEGSSYPNIYIENGSAPHSSYPVATQTKLIDNLASRYIKFTPQSGATARTLRINFNGPNGNDCGGAVIIETADGRKIDQRIQLDANKDGSSIVSNFGGSVESKVDVNTAILVLDNTTQAADGLTFTYSAELLNGADPQITPWGWSWGYRSPFWQTDDIWVDTDMDGISNEPADTVTGQEAEPSVGRVNKLYARVRNLGDSPITSNITVNFSFIPAGMAGASDYESIGSYTITTLGAGASTDVSVNWDMTDTTDTNGGLWPQPIGSHDHFCVKVELVYAADINPNNNLAKNNFANVPVLTSPSPKLFQYLLMIKNPFDRSVMAGVVLGPEIPKGWEIRFPNIENYKAFRLGPREARALIMTVRPPIFQEGEGIAATESTHVYGRGGRKVISQHPLDVSFMIDGQFVGGMSYNLILLPEVEVVRPGRPWAFSLHTGWAIPTGDFDKYFDPGLNLILDVHYRLMPRIVFVGMFGYNRFKEIGDDSFYWLNFSGNLRYYFTPGGPYRFYVGGGPGLYVPETGDNKFGLNGGFGLNYDIRPGLTAEIGGDYHYLFDSDVEFFHIHAGLIFRFP
jgi:hypothetical protein